MSARASRRWSCLTIMSSALAIDGAAMAIVPSAAITYPSFFIWSSSFEWRINIAWPGTFRMKPQRIMNGCSSSCAIDDRLIHQRVDLLAIVPADRAGRCRQIHHREFFLWIDPPVGAARAGPSELTDRSHHPDNAGRGAHRESETESVIGAGRIGIADQVFDVGAQLIRQHVIDRLAGEQLGVAGAPLVHQHGRE